MTSQMTSSTCAAATGLIVCTIGAAGIARTDFQSAGLSLVDGHYQRAVETRFADALPLQDQSIYAWNAIKLGVFGQTSSEVVFADHGWLFTAEEFQRPASEVSFDAELESATTTLAEHGIQLLPVIIPDKARIYDDMLPYARMPQIEVRYADVQELLAEHGFPTIDLSAALNTQRAHTDPFMRTDTHWSPSGAEIAAQEIADVLGDAVVLPSPFETQVSSGQPFVGDLTAFVDVGPYANFLGIEPERLDVATTRSTAAPTGLFDDVSIPIALVGTSFSAREEFNFSGFLQKHTGLDVVNYAVEGQGPFVPMHNFLASDALLTSPPSIVVWEIPERYISLKDTP